jgi:hypothetical protein
MCGKHDKRVSQQADSETLAPSLALGLAQPLLRLVTRAKPGEYRSECSGRKRQMNVKNPERCPPSPVEKTLRRYVGAPSTEDFPRVFGPANCAHGYLAKEVLPWFHRDSRYRKASRLVVRKFPVPCDDALARNGADAIFEHPGRQLMCSEGSLTPTPMVGASRISA